MPCPFCVKVLTVNLGKLPGVATVKVDVDKSKFIVVMEKGHSPNLSLISKTIKDSGYIPLKTERESLNIGELNKPHIEVKSQPCSTCHS